MTIRRILIPLGGGDAEGTILPRLRYLLQKTRAKAIVLRVVEPGDDEELKEARTQTREAAARLIDRGIDTIVRVEAGEIATTIAEVAAEVRASVIALSSHRMSTFRQLAAPGVAAEVVRETRVPVLMIPADLKPGPFGYRFESMLVPVDGTAEGLAIAPHVVEGVKCFNSEVTLVNVAGEEVEPDRIVDALAALKRAKLCFERRDVPVTCSLRRGDDTADALVSFAKENRFDLLAMTTHGRGGLDRLVWGSVMESVMRQLALPMLVLRRDDDLATTVPLRSLVAAS